MPECRADADLFFIFLSFREKKPRGGLRAAATQRRARRPSSHLHRLARSSRVRRRVFALLRARIPNARSRARSSVAVLASEQWPQCRPPLASFRRGSRRRVNRRRINRARRRRRPERFRARPSPPSRLLPRARCAVVHLARIPPPLPRCPEESCPSDECAKSAIHAIHSRDRRDLTTSPPTPPDATPPRRSATTKSPRSTSRERPAPSTSTASTSRTAGRPSPSRSTASAPKAWSSTGGACTTARRIGRRRPRTRCCLTTPAGSGTTSRRDRRS